MAERIRAFDWSRTPLGPLPYWPTSLRTVVDVLLATRFPMALLWGPDLILIYNDAYGVICADKYPAALGRSTRVIWSEVWHINQPNGDLKWVLESAQPVRDVSGKVLGAVASFFDITERKRAQEALRASEERFRVAQEFSPDGFAILRPVRDDKGQVVDFTWVYANATAERFTGKSLRELSGQSLLELYPGHRGTEFMKNYKAVAETGERQVFEAHYGQETVAPTLFRIVVVPVGGGSAVKLHLGRFTALTLKTPCTWGTGRKPQKRKWRERRGSNASSNMWPRNT